MLYICAHYTYWRMESDSISIQNMLWLLCYLYLPTFYLPTYITSNKYACTLWCGLWYHKIVVFQKTFFIFFLCRICNYYNILFLIFNVYLYRHRGSYYIESKCTWCDDGDDECFCCYCCWFYYPASAQSFRFTICNWSVPIISRFLFYLKKFLFCAKFDIMNEFNIINKAEQFGVGWKQ